MKWLGPTTWLKSPLDRDIIAAWTVGAGEGVQYAEGMQYALELTPPPDPDRFSFLALGDSGDSEASGPHFSPQDAVAREMVRDSALPGQSGQARFVVHTGDVVYMTGERRLYERNFRQPYADFLMPESTVDNLVFRLPFLPVPGNHDYYDLQSWLSWLARIPILGAGLRAITHELFAFSMPEGGSKRGKAYMQAFVNSAADTSVHALPYRAGEQTRLPNRYYKFRVGSVDFFALDSNTLEGPPPSIQNAGQVRSDAAERVRELEARADALDKQLRANQLELDRWRTARHEHMAGDATSQAALLEVIVHVHEVLTQLHNALQTAPDSPPAACTEAMEATITAERRWQEARDDFEAADSPAEILEALKALDDASDESCVALRAVEGYLAMLPEGDCRTQALAARDALQQAMERWSKAASLAPRALSDNLHTLSEEALDVQRELALERRHLQYRPADHDAAQLEWLDRSLEEAIRDRPDGWRILYLHHPLYTTISNHCERPDILGLRANLLERIKGKFHLVLSGHSHAFEWFRSEALPQTGIFVTGGGGQVALRPSLLTPKRLSRHPERYAALRRHGVVECAIGGRGPTAADGEDGLLYHYLRIEVTPAALLVIPVGVRRLAHGYRRESPMPVYHAPELPAIRPPLNSRLLKVVEIRRDQPPQARWR